jgi:hypothetical protein
VNRVIVLYCYYLPLCTEESATFIIVFFTIATP